VIRKARPFSIEAMQRRASTKILGIDVPTATAEDTIIAKLEWAKLGRPTASSKTWPVSYALAAVIALPVTRPVDDSTGASAARLRMATSAPRESEGPAVHTKVHTFTATTGDALKHWKR
jgi:hypothetical protein